MLKNRSYIYVCYTKSPFGRCTRAQDKIRAHYCDDSFRFLPQCTVCAYSPVLLWDFLEYSIFFICEMGRCIILVRCSCRALSPLPLAVPVFKKGMFFKKCTRARLASILGGFFVCVSYCVFLFLLIFLL